MQVLRRYLGEAAQLKVILGYRPSSISLLTPHGMNFIHFRAAAIAVHSLGPVDLINCLIAALLG